MSNYVRVLIPYIRALQVQLLRMKATDMEHWCDATEHKLRSTDYGDSLQRIDNLLKAHVLLDADVVGYDTRVQAVRAEGQQIIADGNHLAAEVWGQVEVSSTALRSN